MPTRIPEQYAPGSWRRSGGLLILIAFVGWIPVWSQDTVPGRFQSIRRSLLERLRADSIPSLSVAVAKDGRVIWEEAFGYADIERSVPATTRTRYPIASVSKPLTATALMVLVEQGKLAPDDPANRHLEPPGVQTEIGAAQDVTLRRLAAHTSGVARHDIGYYEDESTSPLPIEDRIRRYAHVVRTPGESYEYSNLGYMILAHIIGRRAERPFGDVLGQTIFEPLGMSHSSLGRAGTPGDEVAQSYDQARRSVPHWEETVAGAGGVYSTAGDLVRFGMLHLGRASGPRPPILSPATLASMRQPIVQTDSGEWYAIGWRVNRTAFGVETIFHTGSNGASARILAFVPGEDLTVSVLANCVTTLPGWVAREVIASFGPRPTIAPHPPTYPTARVGPEPYRPTEALVGRWQGTIRAPDGAVPLVLEFAESGPILVRLASAAVDTAGGVRVEDGYLRGSFSGEVPNRDAVGTRYRLHFKLRQTGDRLTGSVTAGSVAGERVITLSYWTELSRATDARWQD